MTQSYYGGYGRPLGRVGTTQWLHILRDDGHGPGEDGLCGQRVAGRGEVVVVDSLPVEPPPGLSWCPMCLGYFAEQLGLAGVFGALLAEAVR